MISSNQLEARNREVKARNCQPEIDAFMADRVARREVALGRRQAPSGTSAVIPHVTGRPWTVICSYSILKLF